MLFRLDCRHEPIWTPLLIRQTRHQTNYIDISFSALRKLPKPRTYQEQGVAMSGVWGNMGLSGGCLRKSKTADVPLVV
ncbi:unnamed protein product [Ectocarpus sp. CCAP 1310/34]|nr:unnamed protein product [Ectocarpus sp. CCAP 1310/34]